ncbi:MAG: vitamin B12-dependent ribonucleotide reductase [Planctomycetota bacterium]|nr:vitamin B12-dependent ribonucleotide reductase [Planctomycetota bacterium]
MANSTSGDKAASAATAVGKRIPLRLTENALRVLKSRYLKKGPGGEILETPEEMFTRVAKTAARVEAAYGAGPDQIAEMETRFYNMMAAAKFMPNSPTLMNAGREMGMLSACFVLPVGDSIDEIFETVKATAQIQKAGGGTGFSFDRLRPTGDYIRSSGGTTSGPISFWRVLSETTNAIQQGAFRRGANMGMMSVSHPDILKFIEAKQDLNAFTNFNISVKCPDAFMDAMAKDPGQPHVVTNPRTGKKYYLPKNLDIRTYEIGDLVPADEWEGRGRPRVWTIGELFDLIVDHAWATGEPGIVFIDRINEANPTPHTGTIEATNPCGEQPLLPYEACNLGSINLSAFVRGGERGAAEYDWEALRGTVRLATRFLDNIIDANNFPVAKITEMSRANRKIGLGVMGFADALFKLGVPYDSEEGAAWGERFMKFVNDESHAMSEELAGKRGVFPNWKGSVWDVKFGRKMRNAATTTVAPTGTISIIAGCSCGIEPLFSLAFFRNVLGGQRLVEVNPVFEKVARERGFYSAELMEKIAASGSIARIEGIPDDVKRVFVCAHDIKPDWHVRIQSVFQRHCDSSISKTTNFPHEATREDVRKIFLLAYDLRCKGITVYRDGCRKNQPMALAAGKGAKREDREAEDRAGEQPRHPSDGNPGSGSRVAAPPETAQATAAPARPRAAIPVPPEVRPVPTPTILSAVRIRQVTPFGHMHINITVDPRTEREMEVFAQLGKGGDVAASDIEAICRMVSLFLRCGGSLHLVLDQLEGIGSHLSIPSRDGRVMSLADGLAKAIDRYLAAKARFGLKAILLGEVDVSAFCSINGREGTGAGAGAGAGTAPRGNQAAKSGADRLLEAYKVKCPECQGQLQFVEGCIKCPACGFSQC